MGTEQKQPSVSYYSKQKIVCPVCRTEFSREEALTGGGRMIAGDLDEELRRGFEPSVKYGKIYPLIYPVGVCPSCFFAVLWQDFDQLDKRTISRLDEDSDHRKKSLMNIFPECDFRKPRNLISGAASYFLALLCYELFDKTMSPAIKQGLCSLRAAWVCADLNVEQPGKNYDFVSKTFYLKALFFYNEALSREESGEEPITTLKSFGPDIDKNYGFDGVIYLAALLEEKYGQKSDPVLRLKKLDEHKRAIARIFGLGKSSKNKPGPLLEHSRALYDRLTQELKSATSLDFIPEDDQDEA